MVLKGRQFQGCSSACLDLDESSTLTIDLQDGLHTQVKTALDPSHCSMSVDVILEETLCNMGLAGHAPAPGAEPSADRAY